MTYNLSVSWASLIIELLAIIVIIGFSALAAKRGFVDCFFSLITTVVALIVALLLIGGGFKLLLGNKENKGGTSE